MKKTILIIEDTPLQAQLVKEVLEKDGYFTKTALSGQEGLAKASEMVPDLILLDLVMPDINGFEICEKLRKQKKLKDTIIVFLSIRGNDKDFERALEAGADDYIIKPPMPEILSKKVNLYFGGKE